MALSKLQAMFHDVHFDSAIFPICKQVSECCAPMLEACKHFPSLMKVDGLAVVGIHEPEVPRFGSLVKVSDAGRSQLYNQLREAIECPVVSDLSGEWLKVLQKTILRRLPKNSVHKVDQSLLVLQVRNGPPRMNHGLAHCLNHEILNATDVARAGYVFHRPGTEQSLI